MSNAKTASGRKPAHKRLEILIGTWNTTGEIKATDDSPAMTLLATDTYEWLPGGFFMLHSADARMGGNPSRSIEIIGYDAASGDYVTRSYDDQGGSDAFTASLKGRGWSIDGEAARFRGSFNAAGSELKGKWERRSKSGDWLPWMKIKLTKSM